MGVDKSEKKLDESQNRQLEETIRFLGRVPLFKRLPTSDYPAVASASERKSFEDGEVIITQGEKGNEFFLLYEGAAEVLVTNNDGEEEKIAMLRPGDYFGEQAVRKEEERKATVKASGSCETVSITRDKFSSLGLNEKLPVKKRKAIVGAHRKGEQEKGETEKTDKEVALLKKAIENCENLHTLIDIDPERIDMMVNEMWKKTIEAGEVLIKEGDPTADYFYVVDKGSFEVTGPVSGAQSAEDHTQRSKSVKKGKSQAAKEGVLATAKRGESFGELALIHPAPRLATVTAKEDGLVWVLNREDFKEVLHSKVAAKYEEVVLILDQVRFMDNLTQDEKLGVAEALESTKYKKGDEVFIQGEVGKTFYIISEGEMTLQIKGEAGETKNVTASPQEPAFFGENSLLNCEPYEGTLIINSKTAVVQYIDRATVEMLLGPVDEAFAEASLIPFILSGGDTRGGAMCFCCGPRRAGKPKAKNPAPVVVLDEDLNIRRSDLKTLGLLGCGGFGKVTLEQHVATKKTYALKALSKGYVVQARMQESVMNEKTILATTQSDFIVRLHQTFNGNQFLYFLLEVALGGELAETYDRKDFWGKEEHCRFYSASVICGFEHLHERHVIYRDLKPENVLLDAEGFAKITDMGLAKFVVGKTYTCCGTPEYFAPEIVAHSGHARGVDWWTFGVFIWELMVCDCPFTADDTAGIYKNVKKGIKEVKMPKEMKGSTKDLVLELLQPDPEDRLPMKPGGVKNLKQHEYFSNFDFDGLRKRSVKPPYQPKSKSDDPLKNFSASEEDAPEVVEYVDDGSGWDRDF